MYIENATLKPVRANPELFPISEGTVLTRGGNIATGADAYGIVPQNVEIPPITGTISVAVAGKIDLMHPANKGISISDSIMDALDIDFVPRLDGKVPTMQQSDAGKILTAGTDGTASWQAPSGGNQVDFVLTEDLDTGVYSVVSASATFSEICAMFASGVPSATIRINDSYIYSSRAVCDLSPTLTFEFSDILVDPDNELVRVRYYFLENYGEGWNVTFDAADLPYTP